MPVIGWLNQIEGQIDRAIAPFNQGLAETGYVVGRNVALERRDAEGHRERLPELAADLARRRVAVIIATTSTSVETAKAATQTIPVVFVMAGDPVENGVVASLNRPGGNLTGVALLGAEIAGKRLELLHKLVPAANPIAVFEGPQNTDLSRVETRGLQSAARVLGLRLLVFNIQTENDIAAPSRPSLSSTPAQSLSAPTTSSPPHALKSYRSRVAMRYRPRFSIAAPSQTARFWATGPILTMHIDK
jgi:putative ABC transport system substrate-binding protein